MKISTISGFDEESGLGFTSLINDGEFIFNLINYGGNCTEQYSAPSKSYAFVSVDNLMDIISDAIKNNRIRW